MRLKIGSRKSDLARLQSEIVKEALEKVSPGIEIEFYYKPSFGDLNLDMDLTKTQSKGVFTSDLHESLLKGDCDLVVHSWKDLPIEMNEASLIAGTLPREDSRDVLFLKKNFKDKKDLKIFSSSPRREYNINKFFNFLSLDKTFKVEPVRGNIPTRFKKFLEADVDGFVVAAAAIKRLYDYKDFNETNPGLWNELLKVCNWCVLPESLCPSAAAQGALAIEVLKSSKEVLSLVEKINDKKTFNEIIEERDIHKSFGGGCHLALGVTIFENTFGKTTFASGDVKEIKINRNEFVSNKVYPEKISQDKIWVSSQNFKAKRDFIEQDQSLFTSSEPETFVFTRTETLSSETKLSGNKTVYTSGLKTWQKLFEKGCWVNGCLESLGLTFKPEMPWEKNNKKYWFTRSDVKAPDGYELKEAYHLSGDIDARTFENCEYFIWMSGELCLKELKKHPFLKAKKHFLGMGRSYDYVMSETNVMNEENLFTFSNLDQVLNDISLKNEE